MTSLKNVNIQLSSFSLRLLAIIAMCVGGYGLMRGINYYEIQALNWFSFSIFAFLLVEGNTHTSDKGLYFRRFILFTVISEVCYDLMRVGKFYSNRYQSVMLTLLFGLVIMAVSDYLKKKYDNLVLNILFLAASWFIGIQIAQRFNFAFGSFGISIMLAHYVAQHVKYGKIVQLYVFINIAFFLSENVIRVVKIAGLQYPISPEALALLSLPLIWMYKGNRGPNSIYTRIAFYFVMPVVCLGLYAIKTFM